MRLPPETHRSPPGPPQRTWRVAETATYMALIAPQHPASSFTRLPRRRWRVPPPPSAAQPAMRSSRTVASALYVFGRGGHWSWRGRGPADSATICIAVKHCAQPSWGACSLAVNDQPRLAVRQHDLAALTLGGCMLTWQEHNQIGTTVGTHPICAGMPGAGMSSDQG